jgi:hypothetical protein
MQKIICQSFNSILSILLGRFWPFVGLPLYAFASHLALRSEGSFTCHIYCDTGPRFIRVSFEGPAPASTHDVRILRSLRRRFNACDYVIMTIIKMIQLEVESSVSASYLDIGDKTLLIYVIVWSVSREISLSCHTCYDT